MAATVKAFHRDNSCESPLAGLILLFTVGVVRWPPRASRRNSSNIRGVICLTLMIRWPRGLAESSQELDEPTQIAVPEMRSASCDHHGRIVVDEIGPLPREPRELP